MESVTLDGSTVPTKPLNAFSDPRRLHNIYRKATEPAVTKAAMKRVCNLIEAKYEKADLPSVVQENCPHLNDDQREEPCSNYSKNMRVYVRVSSDSGMENSYILN